MLIANRYAEIVKPSLMCHKETSMPGQMYSILKFLLGTAMGLKVFAYMFVIVRPDLGFAVGGWEKEKYGCGQWDEAYEGKKHCNAEAGKARSVI